MKKLFILIAFFLCLIVPESYADYSVGQDYLAGALPSFNRTSSIKYAAPNSSIGILDNTFGDTSSYLNYVLSTFHPAFLRVHIFNSTCVRNRNCGSYEFLKGYTVSSYDTAVRHKDTKLLKIFKQRTSFYRTLQIKYPATTFLISPSLEHNLSKESFRILVDTAISVWPDIKLVNSPEGSNTAERYKGSLIERHGATPFKDADIVSFDGSDGTDINIDKATRSAPSARIIFAWTRSYNCRLVKGFTDPRKRTACPSGNTFELMSHLLDDRGPIPPPPIGACTFHMKGPNGKTINKVNIIPFKSPMIWKPLSEDSGNGDKRANLPVSITYQGDSALSVIGSNNATIGRLTYYGPYQNGLFRYYSGYKNGSNYGGYGFEKRVQAASGSGYSWLKGGGMCVGPFIPGRRNGSYR